MPDPTFSDVDTLTSAISSETAENGNTKTRVANAVGYLKTATVNALAGKMAADALSSGSLAAASGASNPSAENPFATMEDIPDVSPGGASSSALGYVWCAADGSDETGDGTPGTPYATGQVAWDAAVIAGHRRVQFGAGEFTLTVNGEEMILRGVGVSATLLTVTLGTYAGDITTLISAPDATISLSGAAIDGTSGTGENGQNATITLLDAVGTVSFSAGDGGNGAPGNPGPGGVEVYESGGTGETGGTGGNGGTLTINLQRSHVSLTLSEGDGGAGGTGGEGGMGGPDGPQGPGGTGGTGGSNSQIVVNASSGSTLSLVYSPRYVGSPGAGGSGGSGQGNPGEYGTTVFPALTLTGSSCYGTNGGEGIVNLYASLLYGSSWTVNN